MNEPTMVMGSSLLLTHSRGSGLDFAHLAYRNWGQNYFLSSFFGRPRLRRVSGWPTYSIVSLTDGLHNMLPTGRRNYADPRGSLQSC